MFGITIQSFVDTFARALRALDTVEKSSEPRTMEDAYRLAEGCVSILGLGVKMQQTLELCPELSSC